MHQSVIRLYYKHDMNQNTLANKYTDMMHGQYEFAKDHMDSGSELP